MNPKIFPCCMVFVALAAIKSNGQPFNDPFVTPGQPAYVQPSGGFVYFTDPAGNRLGRLTPGAGSLNYFPVPTADSRPKGLAADLAGNVWFVEQAGNKLARFNPTGPILTEFTVPTPNSRPTDLLVDPRGSVWVAEIGASKIAQFDLATVQFHEISTIVPNGLPNVPYQDPQGRIWWVDQGPTQPHAGELLDFTRSPTDPPHFGVLMDPGQNRAVATLLPSGNPSYNLIVGTSANNNVFLYNPSNGVVTQFGLGAPSHGIVLGPDGNAWFTEETNNMIARLDFATSRITEYLIPTPNAGAFDLNFDANGILWFTEGLASKLGSFDPATATFNEYSTLTPGAPVMTAAQSRTFAPVQTIFQGTAVPEPSTAPLVGLGSLGLFLLHGLMLRSRPARGRVA